MTTPDGAEELLAYDKLVIGTGAVPVRPPITGLQGPEALGAADGVHLLHSMGDTFALMRTLEEASPSSAVIVGAGYIGLEMADALTTRGLQVTQMEQLPEVLPTVDPPLGQARPRAARHPWRRGPDRHHSPPDHPGWRRRARTAARLRPRQPTARPCHGWPTPSWSSSASAPTPRSPPAPEQR